MSTTGHPPNESSGAAAAVSIRRYVNDKIAETAKSFDPSEASDFEFLCECGHLACRRIVTMTVAQYRLSEPGSVVGH
jgi:hypothetical protein